MINRPVYIHRINNSLKRSPITALFGSRQCGKTTLARSVENEKQAHYFDLESPADQRRLQNPELMLDSLSGLVILDEIQAIPELFSVLRVMVDKPACSSRYLILGSASPDIVKNASETMAGPALSPLRPRPGGNFSNRKKCRRAKGHCRRRTATGSCSPMKRWTCV